MDSQALMTHVSERLRSELEKEGQLDARLQGMIDTARSAWPSFEVSESDFLHFIADRLPEDGDGSDLDRIHSADVYLVVGCMNGDPAAVEAFHRAHLQTIGRAIRHLDQTGTLEDEIRQRVAEKLLVRKGDDLPRISLYTGRSPLKSWIKVIALRAAIDVKRQARSKDTVGEDAIDSAVAGAEMDYLRLKYKEEFRQAIEKAIGDLSARERTLLKMSIIDDLTVDEIGQHYGVHRATAARWVGKARTNLADKTREQLRDMLKVKNNELDSVLRMIRSRIDISIRRLLRTEVGS
jgi:RNA polymerase sigma-70 factor (ECF subfamily)